MSGKFAQIGGWIGKYRAWFGAFAVLAMLGLGFTALHHLTSEVRLSDVRSALRTVPPLSILIAVGFTMISYLALTSYDVLALRIIGKPLPWRTAALASFTSYTLSHNLGFGWLTGGSARYRAYTAAGLDGPDVARVVAIASATFWMGVIVVAGAALLLRGGPVAVGDFVLPAIAATSLGIAILALAVGFLVLCARGPSSIRLFGWWLPLPNPRQALAQYGVAALDLMAASAALFVLIPGVDAGALPFFIFAYALAIIAALVSHVPGGVGVFESVLLATLPGDASAMFAALILYRVIYYLLPLALGILLLTLSERRRWIGPTARALNDARSVAGGIAPMALATASFVGGIILLLSGSIPAIPARMAALHAIVPLPFIEASHIAASLIGTALLLIAPGLYRRLDGAFIASRALLLAGAIFSLLKGIDYEEALVCLVVAGLLQWTRPAFYRRTALTSQPFSPIWVACILAVVGVSIWVGFFAYKHVEYRDDLWWHFALHGNAPRFLRASFAVGLILTTTAVWRLFSPARIQEASDVRDIAMIRTAIRHARHTDAMLALTGDKRFLVSPSGEAFLMYQVKGSTWVVMGDPIGPIDEWPDLLWAIRASADQAQGRLLFYQLSTEALGMAVELGLLIIKYGEEAIVDLPDFSLEGAHRRSLRQAYGRAVRAGLEFEIVPAGSQSTVLSDLARISNEWLVSKRQTEKGFSLGRFDPVYLANFDCAIARHEGRIVAFANIWATADKAEISIDLMRHSHEAPSGTMDFLFVNIMQWAREAGYATFSLGLAPLSGIEGRRLATTWAKLASLIFNHAERFYGFKGLRAYKEKFAPRWLPRYIAGPHGLSLLRALIDLNKQIGTADTLRSEGNVRTIVARNISP